MISAVGTHTRRRVGLVGLLSISWLWLAGGAASALTLPYDVIDGTAGVFAPTGGGVFIVSQNLDGSLTLETPGVIETGAVLTYTDFELAGTGQLCSTCDVVDLDIVLDTAETSTLEVIDDPADPGMFASQGELFTIWTLTSDTWTLDLAVAAETRFLASRNDVSSTFFSHNYQITSITPLGPIPDGVDISNLEVFKFDSAIVPEPGTLLLMAGGLIGLAASRSGRRRG